MPEDSNRPVELVARLKHLAYPASFAAPLGVEKAKAFVPVVASKALARWQRLPFSRHPRITGRNSHA